MGPQRASPVFALFRGWRLRGSLGKGLGWARCGWPLCPSLLPAPQASLSPQPLFTEASWHRRAWGGVIPALRLPGWGWVCGRGRVDGLLCPGWASLRSRPWGVPTPDAHCRDTLGGGGALGPQVRQISGFEGWVQSRATPLGAAPSAFAPQYHCSLNSRVGTAASDSALTLFPLSPCVSPQPPEPTCWPPAPPPSPPPPPRTWKTLAWTLPPTCPPDPPRIPACGVPGRPPP